MHQKLEELSTLHKTLSDEYGAIVFQDEGWTDEDEQRMTELAQQMGTINRRITETLAEYGYGTKA